MADEKITADVVKARAAIAGVKLDPARYEDIAQSMEQSLAPLRELNLREIRLVEPAISFKAAWSE